MKTKLVLECARQFLIDYGWTRGTFARDKEFKSIDELSEDATCFCSVGAVVRAKVMLGADEVSIQQAVDLLDKQTGFGILMANDASGQKAKNIINIFDEAIKNVS